MQLFAFFMRQTVKETYCIEKNKRTHYDFLNYSYP